MTNAYPPLIFALTFLLKAGALDPETPFKILGQMTGADSLVEAPRVLIAKSASGWNDVWQQHRQTAIIGSLPGAPKVTDGLGDKPTVDFTKNVVLCVFGGQSRNVCGFTVSATGEVKGTMVIQIQPVPLPNSGTGVLQNPYIMLVLPRTKKKMQLQLDQSILGGQGFRVLGDFGPTSQEGS